MNSTCSLRMRWYSSAIGSLTFKIRSPAAQTSSAVGKNRGARGDELVVGDGRPDACVGLDEDLVAVAGEFVDTGGSDGHPVLVVLDLARDADLHGYQRPLVTMGWPMEQPERAGTAVTGPSHPLG